MEVSPSAPPPGIFTLSATVRKCYTNHMQKLRQTSLSLLGRMIYVLPLWVTFGRALVGYPGWWMIFFMVSVAPILLCSLLALRSMAVVTVDKDGNQFVGKTEAVLLTTLYISVALFGFFVVDFGDTEASSGSVATAVFLTTQSISSVLGVIFFIISTLVLVISLVYFTGVRMRYAKTQSKQDTTARTP